METSCDLNKLVFIDTINIFIEEVSCIQGFCAVTFMLYLGPSFNMSNINTGMKLSPPKLIVMYSVHLLYGHTLSIAKIKILRYLTMIMELKMSACDYVNFGLHTEALRLGANKLKIVIIIYFYVSFCKNYSYFKVTLI